MSQREPSLLRLLGRIDWPTALHRGGALLRALRGDGDAIAADQDRERRRAAALHQTINNVARQAVGCLAPDACDCPICSEARGQ